MVSTNQNYTVECRVCYYICYLVQMNEITLTAFPAAPIASWVTSPTSSPYLIIINKYVMFSHCLLSILTLKF